MLKDLIKFTGGLVGDVVNTGKEIVNDAVEMGGELVEVIQEAPSLFEQGYEEGIFTDGNPESKEVDLSKVQTKDLDPQGPGFQRTAE